MAKGAPAGEVWITLVRVMDLLQAHITSALCRRRFDHFVLVEGV